MKDWEGKVINKCLVHAHDDFNRGLLQKLSDIERLERLQDDTNESQAVTGKEFNLWFFTRIVANATRPDLQQIAVANVQEELEKA